MSGGRHLRISILLAALCSAPCVARGSGSAAEAWGDFAAEARQVIEKIYEVHPRGAELRSDAEFRALGEELIADADALDAPHAVVRMLALLARIEDAHTVLVPYTLEEVPFRQVLPLEVGRFEDGYYVTAAAVTRLLGARITAVDGLPVEEAVRRLAAVLPKDNPAWAARWAPLLLRMPALLRGLDIAAGPASAPVRLRGETAGGDLVEATISPLAGGDASMLRVERRPTATERWREEEGTWNFVRVLDERKALYVSLGRMADTERRSFDEFDRIWTDALSRSDLERMVIDLRDNGGGNNMLPEPMRRRIVRSRFNRLGRLYVLIGPRTFSAAQNFANRLERETDALFVGEPTGGRPNHLGDPVELRGPATGGLYLVSTLRWQDSAPFDDRLWILPDVPAPPTFGDYLDGRDAALEAALTHPSDPAEDPARWAAPWARASQRAGWRFFWQEED